MLTLKTPKDFPKLMACGHWSYWLERTPEGYACSACKRGYAKQLDGRKVAKRVELLEHL